MFRNFFNRARELGFLQSRWRETGPQLLVLYGRRRVGKTELIRKFLQGKRSIYFLADGSPLERQLERFLGLLERSLGLVVPRGVNSWADALSLVAKTGRVVLALDEFGYMIQRDSRVLAEVQRAWDEVLSRSRVFVVLCGSAVSVMETDVLGARSPLYGRRTGQWKVEPMGLPDIAPFLKGYVPEDLARAYMTVGGVPAYLEKLDGRTGFFANVEARILTRGEFLYDEPEFLMRAELREPHSYFPIVEGIAQGRTRLSEISGHSRIEVRSLPKYLMVLQQLGVLEKVTPVGEKKLKTRRYVYRIRDPFFDFWFRYVYPEKGLLEMGETSPVIGRVRRDFENYAGERFYQVAVQMAFQLRHGLRVAEYGPWWMGEDEIDLVLLERDGGRYARGVFFEVKWADLGVRDARREMSKLKEKAAAFPLKLRETRLGLLARKIEQAHLLEVEGYLVSDLRMFLGGGPVRQRGPSR